MAAVTALSKQRWPIALALLAVVLGIAFRFANAVEKIYYQDEAITSIRVAGYLLADELALFDGKPHAIATVQDLMKPAPGSSALSTIHSLAVEDPQHPPAFYLAEAFWMRLFGSDPFTLRVFSVLVGLLVLPLSYLLGIELFGSKRIALIATIVFSLSPFFVLYGYQNREYGLFAVAILFSTLLFLRATRLKRKRDWSFYAISISLGIYVYLFFAFIMVAHALAIVVSRAYRGSLVPFVVASVAGLATTLPWLYVITHNSAVALDDVSWATSPYPFALMVAKWCFFAASTLFDVELANAWLAIVAVLCLLLLGYSIFVVARSAETSAKTLLACLGLTTFAILACSDIILHHRLSTIARYLTPTWISLAYAVAFCLGTRLSTRFGMAALAFVFACAVWSDSVSAAQPSWWENSGNKSDPAVAAFVDRHPGILIVSERDYAPLLVIASRMLPQRRWLGFTSVVLPNVTTSLIDENPHILSLTENEHDRLARTFGSRLRIEYDSHDLQSNLSKIRGAYGSERLGANDWGETVLWSISH